MAINLDIFRVFGHPLADEVGKIGHVRAIIPAVCCSLREGLECACQPRVAELQTLQHTCDN